MTYSSLLGVLEGWFDTGKESLPKELRIRVERDFPPVDWSFLTAEQRRYRAEEWDYQHDPAREGERKYWFEHFLRVEPQ